MSTGTVVVIGFAGFDLLFVGWLATLRLRHRRKVRRFQRRAARRMGNLPIGRRTLP